MAIYRDSCGLSENFIFGLGKKIKEDFSIVGKFNMKLWDKYGNLKLDWYKTNTIVDGIGDVLALWDQSGALAQNFEYIALGDSSGGKSQSSSALENEIARKICSSMTVGTGTSSNIVTKVVTFDDGDGAIAGIVEAGLFNQDPGGSMEAYQDFDEVNKGADDTFQITWQIRYGPAQS